MTDVKPSSRLRPAHHTAVEMGNQTVVIFVTVCTKDRQAVLANPTMHEALIGAWTNAQDWRIGRYVIMPDHIHFFCAPGCRDYSALSKWMAYWKSLVARKMKGFGALVDLNGIGIGRSAASSGGTASTPSAIYPPDSLWQRDFWDRQLRSGESYGEKWAYVSANPVRAGLVERVEDWSYHGELNGLRWHDA